MCQSCISCCAILGCELAEHAKQINVTQKVNQIAKFPVLLLMPKAHDSPQKIFLGHFPSLCIPLPPARV